VCVCNPNWRSQGPKPCYMCTVTVHCIYTRHSSSS